MVTVKALEVDAVKLQAILTVIDHVADVLTAGFQIGLCTANAPLPAEGLTVL